jgi:hypothetical protein
MFTFVIELQRRWQQQQQQQQQQLARNAVD